MEKPRVYIDNVTPKPQLIASQLDHACRWLGVSFRRGDHVILKPNLTYPVYEPGVCTSPTFIEGILILLAEHGVSSTWVEGDGGNGAYTADEAFSGHGFPDLVRRYQTTVLNVSQAESIMQPMEVAGRQFKLPIPRLFVDRSFDLFIDVPVFKTHVYTTVSLGYKNLWGLIPDPLRIYYHHLLDRGIIGLTKCFRPDLVLIDGLVSLDGEGPINGFAVETNRFLASAHAGAAELIACRMMGLDPAKPKYLQYAKAEGLLPSESDILLSRPLNEFSVHCFRVRRDIWNHASIQMSRFPFVQRLVYHSALSPAIYFVMGRLRGRNKLQARIATQFWRR